MYPKKEGNMTPNVCSPKMDLEGQFWCHAFQGAMTGFEVGVAGGYLISKALNVIESNPRHTQTHLLQNSLTFGAGFACLGSAINIVNWLGKLSVDYLGFPDLSTSALEGGMMGLQLGSVAAVITTTLKSKARSAVEASWLLPLFVPSAALNEPNCVSMIGKAVLFGALAGLTRRVGVMAIEYTCTDS